MRSQEASFWRRVVVGTLALLALAGCGSDGLNGTALPGGVASGSDGFAVTAEFSDVLDLVPQAAVKVDDVTVGTVRSIKLSDWHAVVSIKVKKNVSLPENATATIRQTSLLGEKFVNLAPPADRPASGKLHEGTRIPLSRTGESVEVEQVLGALSLLLNGGGIAKLKTINSEVAKISTGREGTVRDALNQLDTFVGGLDAQRTQIVRAITSLDALTKDLATQKQTIGNAIDSLAPGVKVLDDQKQQLVQMLSALNNLGQVGTKVINASRDDLVANLNALRPTLSQLVASGDALPKSLDQLLTYPYPPNVMGALVGDYVNLHMTVDLQLGDVLSNLFTSMPKAPPLPPGNGQYPPAGYNGQIGQLPTQPDANGNCAQPKGGQPLTGDQCNRPPGQPWQVTGPDGKPLPSGEANPVQGGLGGLLGGGLAK